jgi:pyrroline-5-carboxylate reductase
MTCESAEADRFNLSLMLAGAGKMGGAMLRAWLDQGYNPRQISVLEPHPSQEVVSLARAKGFVLGCLSGAPQVLVLAMKPQSFDEAATGLESFADQGTLIISILAGKTFANIASRLPRASAIIRAMPNLPAAIGRGITALAANPAVTPVQRSAAEALLGATGRVEWLAGEHLIDAATAVSGSGPAYVFYFAEVLAEAGEALGLPADISARLARGTIEGAGELLFQSPGSTVAELRENVTSPGGTTAAALEILMSEEGLAPVIQRALRAAKRRAEALSG